MVHGESLHVDPDIRRARTLPGWVYTDPAAFELQRARVFAPAWHWVADASVVPQPGRVHPFTLQPGALNEPLLLSRDEGGRLHCLSNVCTHRGTLVCEAPAAATVLRCRYHGRRFGLDGRFLSMPEFEGVEGFPSASDDLRAVPCEAWRALSFVSLAPAQALRDLVADLDRRCAFMPLERATLRPDRSRDYEVRANWALYCENYLEGLHIPFVHPELATALEHAAYRTELCAWSNVQVGIASRAEDAFDLPAGHPDQGQRVAAYWWWLWPCTLFNFYPWGLSLNVVEPLAVDRTRVRFLAYAWDESKLHCGAGAELDRVERQDEAIVESVQQGVGSRLYERGRYSPARETGVHHFHRLLASAMENEL
jgi:choline monooxygenase